MNKQQALQWLIDNVKKWPVPNQGPYPRPFCSGPEWRWVYTSNRFDALFFKNASTEEVIAESEWFIEPLAAPPLVTTMSNLIIEPKPLSRSNALDEIVDNWDVWPTVGGPFQFYWPIGWENVCGVDGDDVKLFFKFGEDFITRDDWENWRYRRDGKAAPLNNREALEFVVKHWETWPVIGRIAPPEKWPAGWNVDPGEKGDDVVLRLLPEFDPITKADWQAASVKDKTDDMVDDGLKPEMSTQDEALAWCEENLIIWPGVEDGAPIDPPDGWVWQQNPAERIEYMLTNGDTSVTYNDWYKPRTSVTRAARAITGRLIEKGSTVSVNHVAEVITALNEEGLLR